MNAIVQMKMFDTIVNHAFLMQKPNGKGSIILQEDFAKFENARKYGLYLHRLNLLEPFYKRIMEGKV